MTVEGRGVPRPISNFQQRLLPALQPAVLVDLALQQLLDHEGTGVMHAQEWKPPAEFDAKIREWMAGHGWRANSTRDYFDEEVYAWRQDTSSGSSLTLWIARSVIENHPAREVVEQLDELGVAERMRRSWARSLEGQDAPA